MRKYYWVFKNEMQNILEYRFNFISSFLFSLVPIGVNVLLWIAVAQSNASFEMSIDEIVSYYIIILISSNLTESNTASFVSKDIRLGDLNKYLIKPCNYSLYYMAKDIPSKLLFLIMNGIPLICIFIVFGTYLSLHLSITRLIMYFVLIGLGYMINFLLDLLIGFYSFYFSKINYFYSTIRVFRNIMAGSIFPLNLLPQNWFSLFSILPFSYVVFFPSSMILTSRYDGELLSIVLGSVTWCMILLGLCGFVWKKGLNHYSAFGG